MKPRIAIAGRIELWTAIWSDREQNDQMKARRAMGIGSERHRGRQSDG